LDALFRRGSTPTYAGWPQFVIETIGGGNRHSFSCPNDFTRSGSIPVPIGRHRRGCDTGSVINSDDDRSRADEMPKNKKVTGN
jgi:hypothetical protein